MRDAFFRARSASKAEFRLRPCLRCGLGPSIAVLLFATSAVADPPFGWRGDGAGRFPDATPVTTWSETKNVRWCVPVGPGYASPILTDKLVIVASEPNRLVAVDRKTGKQAWKIDIRPADLADEKSRKAAGEYEPPKDGSGMFAATPVTDGKSVFVTLANGVVAAVDLDGKLRWTAYIDAEQNTGFGRASSPILASGKLIVHMTNLYAFDPATGKQLWSNTDAASTYGTPTTLKVGDVDLIVTSGGDVVRLADGKMSTSEIAKTKHSSPFVSGGIVYYCEQVPAAIRIDAKLKDKEIWSGKINDEVFGSPLLSGGVVFTTAGKGTLFAFAVDAKGDQPPLIDGRALFKVEEAETPLVYSSMTLAGKHLFVTSNFGETVVLEATREAKVVARNKLPAGSGASPIFSEGAMYLRAGSKLYCIGS